MVNDSTSPLSSSSSFDTPAADDDVWEISATHLTRSATKRKNKKLENRKMLVKRVKCGKKYCQWNVTENLYV